MDCEYNFSFSAASNWLVVLNPKYPVILLNVYKTEAEITFEELIKLALWKLLLRMINQEAIISNKINKKTK